MRRMIFTTHRPDGASSAALAAGTEVRARSAARSSARAGSNAPRGQVLVIFAFLITILLGMAAFVVDMAWIWSHQLQVQRAADAAALAGVIHLPGNVPSAQTTAHNEARKNGFVDGVAGVDVAPSQDATNDRQMLVTISTPVDTFFMRVFGISTVTVTRSSRAEYVLPVPMGSPENYYGVFGKLRTSAGGTTVNTPNSSVTGYRQPATSSAPTGFWTNPNNGWVSDNAYATRNTTTNPFQGYRTFSVPAFPGGATIDGIEVEVEAQGNNAGCRLGVELSSNAGSGTPTWTSTGNFVTLPTTINTFQTLGGATSLWGRAWTTAQVTSTNFGLRVAYIDPGAACANGTIISLDRVRVRFYYTWITSTFIPDANIPDPYGNALTPRGFWGTMISRGSEDVNGDAYLARYEDLSPTVLNPDYRPTQYYDYAVEIPAGAAAGEVWIYDPVFCATDSGGQYGTGDRWFSGTSGATSAYYYLYNTQNTPHDLTDDGLVTSSGALFAGIRASDASTEFAGPAVGGGITSCETGDVTNPADGRYWHNRWWQLASGLAGGTTYRVRTTSTDINNPGFSETANGHNSFAIWTRASGGTPDVYGIGAMQAFSPLDPNGAAEFYLAQIEAVHAGKTVRIELWDPGDTGALSATLQIRIPTAGGYVNATLDWTAALGTTHNNADCKQTAGSGVTSINSNTGNNSQFNGCWVTIDIPIPANYDAPTPPGETEPGWWKIRYNMGNQSTTPAFDLTTWQVEIRGNPVHLVVP